LEENGIIFKQAEKDINNKKLEGLTFVLTGGLENMSRDEAKEKIRDLGGKISSDVSKETDYVIAGADPGSKYNKARELNVKIINEQEFKKMLEN
jgi:DNA ligase (NAD+)